MEPEFSTLIKPEHIYTQDEPMKLLVHNVSHADLCVTIQPSSVIGINRNRELMARPRSSRFKHVCDEILTAIKKGAKYNGITYKDQHNKPKYVGFIFDPPQRLCSWSDFTLRDPNNRTTSHSLSCQIVRVFFPLMSVIVPKWISLISFPTAALQHDTYVIPKYDLNRDRDRPSNESSHLNYKLNDNLSTDSNNKEPSSDQNNNLEQIEEMKMEFNTIYKLYIVSGAGHPLNKKKIYYQEDSTQLLAQLLCRFIKDFYPQIIVKQFFSEQDIFHYLENIKFVHSQLRPAIDKERALLARIHGKHWAKYFNLSITLCDGTPARLSAIIQGLRSFKPDMLHMFRRKSLWIDYPAVDKLWETDFEFLKFNQMETYPAIPLHEIHDETILNMVNEMRKWKKAFIQSAVRNQQSEMSRFWLRKTHQPVLAVLSVQKTHDKQPTYYRGVNVEVSMPTGSLCAERNAIGTALAADPSLRREHFKMIAVLFMGELDKDKSPNTVPNTPLSLYGMGGMIQVSRRTSYLTDEPDDCNPRGPCGSCMEWLTKIAQCNPTFKVITFSSRALEEVIVRNLQ